MDSLEDSGPPKKRRESKDPVGPRSSQVNVLQIEQQNGGQRVARSQWAGEAGRPQQEFGAQRQPSHPAQMLAESGPGMRKVKSGEVQTPRQKEE